MQTASVLLDFGNIAAVADGVMLSRGALGIYVAPEKMAIIQKRITNLCNLMGKPCIITRIVDSMQVRSLALSGAHSGTYPARLSEHHTCFVWVFFQERNANAGNLMGKPALSRAAWKACRCAVNPVLGPILRHISRDCLSNRPALSGHFRSAEACLSAAPLSNICAQRENSSCAQVGWFAAAAA